MNEDFPLERAPEAYDRMMSGRMDFEQSLQQDISDALSSIERDGTILSNSSMQIAGSINLSAGVLDSVVIVVQSSSPCTIAVSFILHVHVDRNERTDNRINGYSSWTKELRKP